MVASRLQQSRVRVNGRLLHGACRLTCPLLHCHRQVSPTLQVEDAIPINWAVSSNSWLGAHSRLVPLQHI